jgi:thiamine biosynthesis lipoprotein
MAVESFLQTAPPVAEPQAVAHAAERFVPQIEAMERFPCFGGMCTVLVEGDGLAVTAAQAATRARDRLERWHRQFSRFDPQSELSRLNSDPNRTVPVTPLMARFVEAALSAAAVTGGLVDPTLVAEIENAGYVQSLDLERSAPTDFLRRVPRPSPARPRPDRRWREIHVDRRNGVVTRPPGLRLDSGGIAKGLFADVLAMALGTHASFAVAAAGDVRFGGTACRLRPVQVTSPIDDSILHTFELVTGAAATSGISKRSWIGSDGEAAHHLLDPASGKPAFTGVLQVTALAPTGVQAEALSKAALLSGAKRATAWLPHGGLVVYADSSIDVVAPPSGEMEP